MAFEGSGSKEYLLVDGRELQLTHEGRGDNRKLFVEFEDEQRRLVFQTDRFALLEGPNGDERRLTPLGENGAGDYVIVNQTRSLGQNICKLFGLACRGEDPKTILQLSDGVQGVITKVEGPKGGYEVVEIDGAKRRFSQQSQTDLVVLQSADKADEPLAGELKRFSEGAYKTRVEQEALYLNILYLSLALIIAGVGFLKANISTIVGALYNVGDKRRDGGFTIFYMGINLGAFMSSILCGWLGFAYGWKYGFGLAGIGMLAGLLIFLRYQPWLEGRAEPPHPEKLKEKVLGPLNVEQTCYLTGVMMVALSMGLVMNEDLVGGLLTPIGIAMLVFLIGYAWVKLQGVERDRMLVAIYVTLAQIPFWALFEQAGSSLNLFTDRLVDRTAFGFEVPAPIFQSLNAGFIIIFAPIIAWVWGALYKRGLEPTTPVKMAFGVFMAGLGFLALVAGMQASGSSGLTAVYFIFLIYWIHTMGELMLSPVGLSAVTKLAPARVVGMTMGAWFLFSGFSNFLAGVIARTTGAETIGGQIVDAAMSGLSVRVRLILYIVSKLVPQDLKILRKAIRLSPRFENLSGQSLEKRKHLLENSTPQALSALELLEALRLLEILLNLNTVKNISPNIR